jgi:hypothetical protein
MKASEYIDEEQLLNSAIRLLTEKLGAVETSRFLSISRAKRIESVKRHRQWQARIEKDQLFKEIFGE